MRVLMVEPGPAFSVADVHNGWLRAFKRAGVDVANFNLNDRLNFMGMALDGRVSEDERPHLAASTVAEQLHGVVYAWWPDVIVVTSAFFIPPRSWDLLRARGHKTVALLTESPYEDTAEGQLGIAAHADVAIVNDPTHLDRFREVQPNTFFLGHAWDPEIHYRRPPSPELKCDIGWAGTGYPSRIAFFEQLHRRLPGVDLLLGGNWQTLDDASPLTSCLLNDRELCLDNDDTADLYSSCRMSLNTYRREAAHAGLEDGWAMGPREVELAALGTFFLTEPRGENRAVLPMIPTFDGPEDCAEQVRWWLDHDDERTEVARQAQAAVTGRTFDRHVSWLLGVLDGSARTAGPT